MSIDKDSYKGDGWNGYCQWSHERSHVDFWLLIVDDRAKGHMLTLDFTLMAAMLKIVFKELRINGLLVTLMTEVGKAAVKSEVFIMPLWFLLESSGIIFGRVPCQNCHSGYHLFQQNRAIMELGPEWS